MTDPLALSVLGAAALTEGIKFLYGQATELLRRRRERRDEAAALEVEPAEVPELDGELRLPLRADGAVLERVEPDLKELRRKLQDYADGVEEVASDDRGLLESADAVRRLLEAVYGQRITFRGEQRAASGPVVEGGIDVDVVAGYVAAVRARAVTGGATVRASVRANEVAEGAEVIGVDVDRIGG
ncbi:hypothetical protein FHX81_0547 [Saccharothrix saharensis]|uniref:Uncharacterized protein n=1 Tax=Saccharothrix saharensis TaxID=571190 RepID=A0A543J619_9PSEU|nr:hypothetical protein [Saccharothrix saharensis]TQM78285.1 hypothetical protein FHX81_0547 [Saccharothrix saharensis]